MTTIEWAAGLFEGEGSAGVYVYETGNKGRYLQKLVRVQLGMTDEAPVRAFHAILGVGRVRLHPSNREGWADRWDWVASNKRDAQAAARALLPLVSPRRQAQLQEVLDA